MNEQTKSDYIKYRIEKAFESMEDAKLLAQNNRWNACINRLYYSAFYAVIAFLIQENNNSSTHNGARNQFNIKFIHSGLINKNFGKLYSKLFDWRQKGDYGDMFNFNKEQILPLIEQTQEFIAEIQKLIK